MNRIGSALALCGPMLFAACGGPKSSDPPSSQDFPTQYLGSLAFIVETADQPAGTFRAIGTLSPLTLTGNDARLYRGTASANVAIAFNFPNAVCDASSVRVDMDVELRLNDDIATYGVSATAPLVVQTRCCAGADCFDVKLDTVLGATSSCNGSSNPVLPGRDHLAETQWRTQCGDPASGTVISTLSWNFDAC
jgi:hypothetical protein